MTWLQSKLNWAYPRSRGGTVSMSFCMRSFGGLSPLTRGNLFQLNLQQVQIGPIPAHAGEPLCVSSHPPPFWAYPRSRGGTTRQVIVLWPRWGLSPLTRGNLGNCDARNAFLRPIPAHAGEPLLPRSARPSYRAYPRSRGGTQSGSNQGSDSEGLSPLTRGNRSGQVQLPLPAGPIPAHAGEPIKP